MLRWVIRSWGTTTTSSILHHPRSPVRMWPSRPRQVSIPVIALDWKWPFGHRNSDFSIEHGDFPCFVFNSLPNSNSRLFDKYFNSSTMLNISLETHHDYKNWVLLCCMGQSSCTATLLSNYKTSTHQRRKHNMTSRYIENISIVQEKYLIKCIQHYSAMNIIRM